MEIKTCEEYVLSELDICSKSLTSANNTIKNYTKILKVVAKYLKNDGHGNIIVSEFSFDPVSRGRVLILPEHDKEILLALSQLEKSGMLDTED